MRVSLLAQQIEALPSRTALDHGEMIRVATAFAALVAAVLLVVSGLLWREHTRAPPPHEPTAAQVR